MSAKNTTPTFDAHNKDLMRLIPNQLRRMRDWIITAVAPWIPVELGIGSWRGRRWRINVQSNNQQLDQWFRWQGSYMNNLTDTEAEAFQKKPNFEPECKFEQKVAVHCWSKGSQILKSSKKTVSQKPRFSCCTCLENPLDFVCLWNVPFPNFFEKFFFTKFFSNHGVFSLKLQVPLLSTMSFLLQVQCIPLCSLLVKSPTMMMFKFNKAIQIKALLSTSQITKCWSTCWCQRRGKRWRRWNATHFRHHWRLCRAPHETNHARQDCYPS